MSGPAVGLGTKADSEDAAYRGNSNFGGIESSAATSLTIGVSSLSCRGARNADDIMASVKNDFERYSGCGPGILAGTLKPNNSQRRSFFNRGHDITIMPALSVCPPPPKHGFVRFDRESKSTEQGRTDDASLLEVCAWVGIGDWGGFSLIRWAS